MTCSHGNPFGSDRPLDGGGDLGDQRGKAANQGHGQLQHWSALLKRMKHGRAEKARQGGYIGGAVPFGRRVVDGEFAADEAELAVVARARELHGQGMSFARIAATLEAEGHRTKNGARWYPRTARRMLAAG